MSTSDTGVQAVSACEDVSVLDEAVDKSKFKSCSQLSFYRRQKRLLPGKSLYRALLDSFTLHNGIAKLQIIHEETKVPLLIEIYGIEGNILRLRINELSPLKPRYEVPDVLVTEPALHRLTVIQEEADVVVLGYDEGDHKVHITASPFQIDVLFKEDVVLRINSLGLLYFEHLQPPPKKRDQSEEKSDVPAISSEDGEEDLGLWKEKFGSFVDYKASGPSSVGLDFSLHGYEHVYGLPERTEPLQLQSTSDSNAYRLYNLDVFGYELQSKMGLYGSVPLLLAHKPEQTIGIFWLNASETLVELSTKPVFIETTTDMTKKRVVPETDIRWISESGIMDAFLLMGPSPFDVFRQYTQLTGSQSLPPLFSLGYHQCRWNYEDEEDVKAVDDGFDEHDIPYDVIWLDIEHTEGKRYFTWDKEKFPSPKKMQESLQSKKRKLVIISDPHIKIDPEYPLYSQAKEGGYFVKDRQSKDFVGVCWPGSSCYLDFTSPEVRKWYSAQFTFSSYRGSTDILFVWNDMNEPSVFKGPELTMPKDNVHCGGWEHRDLHNLYGFYQQMASAEGLIQRSGGIERPFVLTRSFFAGSQRYGAVWTGDNNSEWGYLKISIPMLLTISIAGISFCGADVGGFIGNPDPELLVRWYQAGAYQPFFRGHATMDSKRREPWLFGADNTQIIREVIRERYALLPYWYLLFYRAHVSAEPVMRPLWVDFPQQLETFGIEDQYMVGNALLVHPVTDPEVISVDVLLPRSDEIWYNFRTFERFVGLSTLKVPVTLDSIPVFQRGGTVIPLKTIVGKSTEWMKGISYELRVALDSKRSATGELYTDDGHSFQYLHEDHFLYRRFTFHKNILSSSCADEKGRYSTECVIERILILGLRKQPASVTTIEPGRRHQKVTFAYNPRTSVLTVEKLSLGLGADWKMHVA
uniref:Neutral alpha-glucosidase C isoform X2 n=1 Tax=Geotrypetes seraphini TaxID=260995 RepID=A0A6P8RTV4_GEOSA|nr:neutral alpha-glucosidase C isoform X2 [Geotrypetes seraphini]